MLKLTTVSFLYENCDVISIPMSYIVCLDIFDGKIRKVTINKDFLRECRKFHEFSQHIDDLDYSKERLLDGYDICYIDIDKKRYAVNYIGINGNDYCDNVLQSIEEEDDVLIFSWDIDDRNYVDYTEESIDVYINEKYKNKFSEECSVKYWSD